VNLDSKSVTSLLGNEYDGNNYDHDDGIGSTASCPLLVARHRDRRHMSTVSYVGMEYRPCLVNVANWRLLLQGGFR